MDSLYLFILKFYKKSSMKKLQLLFSIFFVLNTVYAQNQVSLTFKYKFLNSNAGYTYPTKMEVYRNGNKIGQSSEKDQTESNQITVDFPKGTATITAIVFAKINDKWEARTTANNYSLDFQYNKTYDWSKDATIEMVYNISSVTLDINEPDYLKKIKNTSPVIENSSDSEDEEYGSLSDDLDKYKSNIDITNSSGNSTSGYQTTLEKLNSFLKPIDTELSKWIEVKDGYIIEHFRGTYTCKAKISDIEGVEKVSYYNVVHLYCKNKSNCVYSDYMKSNYDYFNYNCSSTSQMNTLYGLMTEFWNQLKKEESSVSSLSGKKNEDNNVDALSNSSSQNTQPSESVKELLEFQKFADEVRKATQEKNYNSSTTTSQETVTLTFKYRYRFSNKYYARNTKIKVFNNGKTLGESVAKMEYEGNQVSITIPKGVVGVYAKVYAYRDGIWEPYTARFKYPVNSCVYIQKDWQRDEIFDLYFDLDNQYVTINNKDYPCPGYYEKIYYDEDDEEYRIGYDEEHDVIVDPYRYTPIYGK